MTRKDFADIHAMCLNIIHGKDHWLYREISGDRAKEIATSLIDEEFHRTKNALQIFKMLPIKEQIDTIKRLRRNINAKDD